MEDNKNKMAAVGAGIFTDAMRFQAQENDLESEEMNQQLIKFEGRLASVIRNGLESSSTYNVFAEHHDIDEVIAFVAQESGIAGSASGDLMILKQKLPPQTNILINQSEDKIICNLGLGSEDAILSPFEGYDALEKLKKNQKGRELLEKIKHMKSKKEKEEDDKHTGHHGGGKKGAKNDKKKNSKKKGLLGLVSSVVN